MQNEITELIQSRRQDIITFLRDIVAIPSPGGKEDRVIQRIKQEMESLGYDSVWTDSMGNLFGRMGSGDQLLMIDGHCDTVDTGNMTTWKTDPFVGKIEDGKIYGRGTADQKSGIAAAIYAGSFLKTMELPDNIAVVIAVSVLEEDYEGLCWKHIIDEEQMQPRAVLLTEPTDGMIKIGQRGRMEMKLKVNGISSHGSRPELGENAIYKMTPVIQQIEELNNRLTSDSILGKGSITVTDIKSRAPSLCAVPDSAAIHLDRRVTLSETRESCLQEIRDLPALQHISFELHVPEYEVKSYTGLTVKEKAFVPMWVMNQGDDLVQTAVTAFQSQFNHPPQIGVWKFSTNGVTTNGIYNIPTVGFGPGSESQAHAPNEHVTVTDLLEAVEFYMAFTLTWAEDQ